MDILVWVVMGAILGLLGGVFGIGGGLMAIPLLGLAAGMEQQLAQGTALVMVLPNVLLAAVQYHRHARIDLGVVVIVSLCAMGCTWLGAQLALGTDPAALRRGFAVFLGLIGLQYIWQSLRKPLPPGGAARGIGKPPAAMLGVFAGVLGGFFGVGGGILVAPVLSGVFRTAQTVAQGMALAVVVPTAAVGLASYGAGGQVSWRIGIPMAVGGLLFVRPGVRLAHRLPEARLKQAFAALLMLIALALWFSAG